ncbi:MAG TPA: aldo/keto reductase, partial [Gemmataceae bacterium]
PEEEAPRLLDLARRAESQPAEVRSALARLAARWGCPETGDLLRRLLDDPAPEAQAEALRGLGRRPDVPVGEEVLAPLLASENATVRAEAVRTWVRRGGETSRLGPLADDSDVRVRLALAESLAGRDDPLLSRLQADPHPHVRAAALTPSRAAELIEDPTRETSWHVLTKAARLRKVPIWEIEPDPPWRPERAPPVPAEALHLERPAPPAARLLGPGRLAVSPIGVSGHYGLPVEGFVRAAEQGVSLMFWEPNYQTLTDFFARLSPAARRAIHLITGTFEADGDRVRRDAERALRLLNVERLALFLIFWVQSWDRITPDVREALERLKAQGKVAGYGLSTHSWALAAEAIDAGWDPVMTRHSAAHRRAEEHVFPHAVRRGTSVLTFSNTCYGRLLKPAGDLPPPQPSDCLRYTLRQPGVTACLTAPATVEFLEENLRAMREPELPEDRLRHLLACGERVYQEDTTFRKLVRAL